jgi:tetratricopeptide (TPR) repeat protein
VRAPLHTRRLICAALVVVAVGCATGTKTVALVPVKPEPTERDVELFVQRRLSDARAFREQGRLEAAERAARRAVEVAPEDARAHRLLARILEDQGRTSQAREQWATADALDPPPPPPSDSPLSVKSEGVVVLLVDQADPGDSPGARARRPDPRVEETILRGRLGARLPLAEMVRADPASIAEARTTLMERGARAAISLRTDRGFCGYSRKDGDFGVAWLRVASATPTALVEPPTTVREVIVDPPSGDACLRLVMARALERVLVETDVVRAVMESAPSGQWPSPALRALFPGIGRRVAVEIERGRARLATGRVSEAADSFRAALEIDPEHPDALAYLREAEETMAIARALDPDGATSAEVGDLDFTLTDTERNIAEALLAEERRRRDELLAALVISEVEERPPPPEAVAILRPVALAEAPAPGPRLARTASEGAVEARVLYADDGTVLTTYYFAVGSQDPLLREEDTSGDGQPDRWIAYQEGLRNALFEDRNGNGQPDVTVRFDAEGRVAAIELDANDDRRPERVFRYADGTLASEARDTDGDGDLDRFETLDAEGRVVQREEDLNGDGHVDVRSTYRDGKLVSREIEDPRVVEQLLDDPEEPRG